LKTENEKEQNIFKKNHKVVVSEPGVGMER